jgi:hypothetical protein
VINLVYALVRYSIKKVDLLPSLVKSFQIRAKNYTTYDKEFYAIVRALGH